MATAPSHSRTKSTVFYRERDGKPMAETPIHQEVMIELIVGLRDWFANDPQVYVAGNLFVYFVEGHPTHNVSPDVMVVRGVDRDRPRNTYKTWEDGGKGPDLVVEVSSKSTRRDDLRQKFLLYRDELKVREYFLFDPFGEYLKPPLQGFRLNGGEYFAIDPEAGRLPSEVLDLHLVTVGQTVRLFDPRTGQIVPNRLEALCEQESAVRERDLAIREREATIANQSLAIEQKDRDLARADLERDRLLAEIARLRAPERSD